MMHEECSKTKHNSQEETSNESICLNFVILFENLFDLNIEKTDEIYFEGEIRDQVYYF